ncbi:MAG: prepilin-type N-terminal cleavage/methylation domain-containing protein [Candidatus Wallbacteria bacterium]|nr:prepilin-type N-terminal cleavage/methylation domain-containing protein [Candidatus Wallbacteria bacterium]
MKRGFTILETMLSLSLLSLVLLLVFSIGKNASSTFSAGLSDANNLEQDEDMLLYLKPIFDNLRLIKWEPVNNRIFLATSSETAEVILEEGNLVLRKGSKLRNLSRNKITGFSFSFDGRIAMLELSSAGKKKSYFFHPVCYLNDPDEKI